MNNMSEEQPPPYELGFCPVCGYEGWPGLVAGDDYDDCPCCRVDFCVFTCRHDDPRPLRKEWLASVGLTPTTFIQLTRNLRVVPDRPATWPTIVHEAALGRLGDVEAQLEAIEDVDATNERGETALMWAAWMGYGKVVDLLLASGADIAHKSGPDPLNERTAAGATAIAWAARAGHADIVRTLLSSAKALSRDTINPVDGEDAAGGTPLIEAAVHRSADCVNVLIEYGADVRHRAHDGTTALARAAEAMSLDVVNTLIEAGADIDAYLTSGDRPLILAFRNWRKDPVAARAICHRLLLSGADPNLPGAYDYSAPLLTAIELQDERLVKQLLELGASPDVRIWRNPRTKHCWRSVPLSSAASASQSQKSLRILRRLLSLGVTIDADLAMGMTPLCSAILNSNWRAAEMLIEAGADLHADLVSSGITPLVYCAWNAGAAKWIDSYLVPRIGAESVQKAREFTPSPEQSARAKEAERRWLEGEVDLAGDGAQ